MFGASELPADDFLEDIEPDESLLLCKLVFTGESGRDWSLGEAPATGFVPGGGRVGLGGGPFSPGGCGVLPLRGGT